MKLPYATLLATAALVLGYLLRGFLAEDACMDAGGVWDDRRGLCQGIEWQEPMSAQ